MNTKFLLSPAYLVSIAPLLSRVRCSRVVGSCSSGGFCASLVCASNAMTLVVLTNREQLYAMDARAAAGTPRRGFSERSAPVVRALPPPPMSLPRLPKHRIPRSQRKAARPFSVARPPNSNVKNPSNLWFEGVLHILGRVVLAGG